MEEKSGWNVERWEKQSRQRASREWRGWSCVAMERADPHESAIMIKTDDLELLLTLLSRRWPKALFDLGICSDETHANTQRRGWDYVNLAFILLFLPSVTSSNEGHSQTENEKDGQNDGPKRVNIIYCTVFKEAIVSSLAWTDIFFSTESRSIVCRNSWNGSWEKEEDKSDSYSWFFSYLDGDLQILLPHSSRSDDDDVVRKGKSQLESIAPVFCYLSSCFLFLIIFTEKIMPKKAASGIDARRPCLPPPPRRRHHRIFFTASGRTPLRVTNSRDGEKIARKNRGKRK